MGESGRDFKRDYEAAAAAEESARDRLAEAGGWASKFALQALVLYRKLDTAVTRDLARVPETKKQTRLRFDD